MLPFLYIIHTSTVPAMQSMLGVRLAGRYGDEERGQGGTEMSVDG